MYTLESRVRYSECDKTGKLSLVGAMNYLQDCSSFHSEHIGRGFEALAQEHLAWVLASWQIEVVRMPHFNEKITVGTWAYELGGLSASRCFVILDEKGAAVVRADSTWYMVDTEAGKAIRVPESEAAYISNTPRLDMSPMPRRIPVTGTPTEAPSITVLQQHLDTNKHVNNAQYVMMAIDALSSLGYPFALELSSNIVVRLILTMSFSPESIKMRQASPSPLIHRNIKPMQSSDWRSNMTQVGSEPAAAKPVKRVVAAIVYRNNAVLACKRDEDRDMGGLWEFAGGKIEAGENPECALRREIQEELGVELQLILPYDTLEYDYPDFHLSMEVFVCTLAPNQEPQKLIHSELRWLHQSELLDVKWLPADTNLVMTLGTLWDDIFESQHL